MEELRDCWEEMVKFTLDSRADFDLELSGDFCSGLLADDPGHPFLLAESDTAVAGVPGYPLYKRLALGLLNSIASGSFCGAYKKIALMKEESWLKEKEEEWGRLILQKGSELVNALKDMALELRVQEPLLSPLKGVEMFRKLYTVEQERSNGIVAIHVSKADAQPFINLANILSGLSYIGMQRLLGLSHTTGSILHALPPPRSILSSSFMLPYKPKVKGCTLSHGARALAKHVDRSSDRFWGILHGSDSDKNRLAADIFNRLVAHCCWMNIHIVQPHDQVFEIRVAEGYGARWSRDGTKFIGFLEPYMDDGHSQGWKH